MSTTKLTHSTMVDSIAKEIWDLDGISCQKHMEIRKLNEQFNKVKDEFTSKIDALNKEISDLDAKIEKLDKVLTIIKSI